MVKKAPIVLIDDDRDEEAVLREILKKLNIENELIYFPTGELALEHLKQTEVTPLFILSDINMPGMNGLELRQLIFDDARARRRSIPFIFITTSSGNLSIDEAYEMSVQGFFQKPLEFTEYKRLIQLIYDYWTVCRHPNSLEK